MSTGLPTEQADGIVFSIEVPSSQLTLVITLTKLTNTHAVPGVHAVGSYQQNFLLRLALDSVYPYWLRPLGWSKCVFSETSEGKWRISVFC